jgi:hypothetical protein
MSEKFTPGPWRIDEDAPNQIITDTGHPAREEILIATIENYPFGDEEGEANARLIAASKDLYKACQDLLICSMSTSCLDCPINCQPGTNTPQDNARAALAKATGGEE